MILLWHGELGLRVCHALSIIPQFPQASYVYIGFGRPQLKHAEPLAVQVAGFLRQLPGRVAALESGFQR